MNHSEQRDRKPGREWLRPMASLLMIIALLGTGVAAGASQGPGSPGPDATSGHPKLEWSLNQLLFAYDRAGMMGARAFSDTGAVELQDGRVTVTIHAAPKAIEDLAASMPGLGGEVRSSYGERLVARVPIDALEPLAERENVRLITEPRRPVLLEPEMAGRYTSEGVAASKASAWHTAGYLGAGVRIAVIDAGYSGYASLLGSDLPDTVVTYDWTGTGIGGTSHGTAVAEIIYDMAPQATISLHKVTYATDLGQAVDQAIADGADVISMSLGWTIDGPGDGTGYLADIVAKARQNGIFYATAAGNEADETWHGAYQDDGSDRHQWAPGEWINELTSYVHAGDAIRIGLHWDDWSSTGQDYDLELYRWTGSAWTLETASRNRQSAGYAAPEEWIGLYAPSGGTYGLVVSRYSASRNVCFRVLTPKMGALDHFSAGRSLTFPADSTSAISGGALDVNSPYPLEGYSSRGPNFGPGGACTGGSTKPDLGGYANVSTVSYGPTYFDGTSSATPHLAGAAALVKGAFAAYTPAQVQAFLEQRAVDQGPPGKDNAYGAGRLHLGTPPNGGNTPPVLSGLPDQALPMDTSKDQAIDLWAYTSDAESSDADLVFAIDNTPEPSVGVAISDNRYVAIQPAGGWTGQTDVTVTATDPGGLSGASTFKVTVTGSVTTWSGGSSVDWHTARNWSPKGVPTAGDDVVIPDAARDPVIASGNAATRNLTIRQGAVLDLTNRDLTVEGALANYGTLRQTRPLAGSGKTSFLRIRNQAGNQTRYYGMELTPSATASRTDSEALAPQPALLVAPKPSRPGTLPASTLGQKNLTPIADAGLLQGYPSTNYGGVWSIPSLDRPTGMMLSGYDTHLEPNGKVARGLLEFDVSDLPDGTEITQATLRLYLIVSYGSSDSNLSVTTSRATAGWSEDTVTWKNSPGYAGAAGSQSIPHGAWGWYEFDVTEMVRAWHEGTRKNYGIYLRGEESEMGWRGFATREETTSPQLIVQHSDSSNAAPVITGLYDQILPENGTLKWAIDLWLYSSDAEDDQADLDYSIHNSPNPGAGVSIDANRYLDVNPRTGWTGSTDVRIRVEDTGGLADTDTFRVTVIEAPVVTVAIDGHQHCSGRITGVNRCYEIKSTAPLEATVRYYFTETERLGLVLDELNVYRYAGDWQQEPGPTGNGSVDLTLGLYVEAQRVESLSPFALDTEAGSANTLYLPIAARQEPQAPDAPVLNPINNPDGGGSYTVSWQPSARATAYTLQEDDNIFFSSPTVRYTGPSTSWQASNMRPGFHYYRVRASGVSGDSAWSDVQSVEVEPDPAQSKYFAREDAGVYQGVPDQNFGSFTDMWAGFGLANCGTPVDYDISRSLLKFDLASIPGGTRLDEASLYVKVYRLCYRQPTTPRTATTYRATDAWSEESVTWDNQPVAGEAYGSTSIAFLDAGKWHAFDVTDLVRGWVNGSLSNEGLIVRGPEKDDSDMAWLGFYTRESDDAPYLQVTFPDAAAAAASASDAVAEAGPGGPLLVAGCESSDAGDLSISCARE